MSIYYFFKYIRNFFENILMCLDIIDMKYFYYLKKIQVSINF